MAAVGVLALLPGDLDPEAPDVVFPYINSRLSAKVPMPKSKVRKKNDFTIKPVSRTPVKVKAGPSSVWFVVLFIGLMLIGFAMSWTTSSVFRPLPVM